ncbi:hypothetical protein CSV78_04455 [Sporosarcina sp. P16a]|uniref:oligosaccharide flippase family protein n=1 Tax=unclassified Sporosarcina TaxID=2647733 RepID=UPI000C16A09C|nr:MULTISPECIES: oligosaccharide flippase family protein [unclassified Sporosarcina]PIC68049.1 hypothetical protein CSV78_04455 [Sporosarcina sp. P16a]PIC94358.1 hypothetical protein CSV70_01095 [Sporosarcina sp. P25]
MAKDQIKSGALLSYVNIILTTFSGLLFTPFLLRHLGQSEYGLYMLIGSIVGYIAIMDLGLHNTMYRFISKYQSEKNDKKQENFLATIFLIYGLISLLVLLIGTLLVMNLDLFFAHSLTDAEFSKAKIMAAILVFNLMLSLPLGAFHFIANGYGRFVVVNVIGIVRICLRIGVLITLLLMGYKSIAIVIIDTILNIGIGVVYAIYCFNHLKIKIRLYKFDMEFIKEIMNYSFFIFITAIVNQLFWRIGQVTLGIYSSTVAVALYALSLTLVIYYQQLSLAISNVFMPKVSNLVSEGASGEVLTSLMIQIGRIQFVILGIVLSGFIVTGQSFIEFWAGEEYGEVYWITLLIFIPVTVPMFQTLGGVILQVKSMHRFEAKAYLVMALLNIPLSIWLGMLYGPMGIGISTAVSIIIFQIGVINWYYQYKIGINVPRFFRETLKGILPTVIVTVLLGQLVNSMGWEGWLALLLKMVFVAVTYIVLLSFFGLNSSERAIFSGYRVIVRKRFKYL